MDAREAVPDSVLPIDSTSRVILPRLQDDGYEVSYVEFDGGHTVPGDVATQAMQWLVG